MELGAHYWAASLVCDSLQAGGDLGTVCCLIVGCVCVLEIGEAIVRVQ